MPDSGKVWSIRFPAHDKDLEDFWFKADRNRERIFFEAVRKAMYDQLPTAQAKVVDLKLQLLQAEEQVKKLQVIDMRERRRKLEAFDLNSFYMKCYNLMVRKETKDLITAIQDAYESGCLSDEQFAKAQKDYGVKIEG